MRTAVFIFHPDLDFFLHRLSQGKPVPLTFENHQSVKHLIESLGVPHVEIGNITANDLQVDFGYLPKDRDRIDIFPESPGCPIEPRFILDGHLGRLAAYLRMLGLDTLYKNHINDSDLADIAIMENRILLTRDRRLLMRKTIEHGFCLRSLNPREQLSEVVRRFDLAGRAVPFMRCMRCNGILFEVNKNDILDQLLPLTKKYYEEFVFCPTCNQIYWKGSHFERMSALIAQSIS
jgi:uncharacterized protein with PIN domain